MKITKTRLKEIIKEELNGALRTIFLILFIIDPKTLAADYGADTTAKLEDYDIDEYILDKGRS
jgi:hypothetical protein